jgi:hypothetical protein
VVDLGGRFKHIGILEASNAKNTLRQGTILGVNNMTCGGDWNDGGDSDSALRATGMGGNSYRNVQYPQMHQE